MVMCMRRCCLSTHSYAIPCNELQAAASEGFCHDHPEAQTAMFQLTFTICDPVFVVRCWREDIVVISQVQVQ